MRIDTLLFVFNRPKHTAEVVNALLAQTKKPDNLYVYFDKAVTEKDVELQSQISNYFDSIQMFDNVYYYEQPSPKGIKKSITDAISVHFEDGADAVIIIEDDIKMHPSTIQYMYDALNLYKNSTTVNTVCAYRYPVLNFIKGTNLYGMLIKRFNPWGWATWKHKWKFESFPDLKKQLLEAKTILPNHLSEYLEREDFINETVDIWSINVVLRQYLMNTYSIYPSQQLVDNIGFDNSGVHSTETTAFEDEVFWDRKFDAKLNTMSYSDVYETALDEFLEKHLKEVMNKNDKKGTPQ